jgi:hypothetical protein
LITSLLFQFPCFVARVGCLCASPVVPRAPSRPLLSTRRCLDPRALFKHTASPPQSSAVGHGFAELRESSQPDGWVTLPQSHYRHSVRSPTHVLHRYRTLCQSSLSERSGFVTTRWDLGLLFLNPHPHPLLSHDTDTSRRE